MANEYAS